MALDKRVVPVLLRGLDQRGPKQTAITGELDLLSNMVIVKGNEGGYELVPRPGEAAVSKTADVGSITTGMRLATLGSALVLMTGTSCYRKAIDGWHRVDATAPVVGVDTKQIPSINAGCSATDAVYVNGYTVSVASVRASATTRSAIASVSDANGVTVVTSTLATGQVHAVKVVASGAVAVVFWQIEGGLLRAAKLDTASPSAFGAAVTVSSTAETPPYIFDAQRVPASGRIAVLHRETGTLRLAQVLLDPATMTTSGATTYASLASLTMFGYLTNDFSTNVLYVGHVDAASGLRVTTFDGATLALGSTVVYDAAITVAMNITGYRTGASVSVYFTAEASPNVYDGAIKLSTGGASTTIRRSIGLASKVLSANGTLYALTVYSGTNLSTPLRSYFLTDLVAQKEVAHALPQKGGVFNSLALPELTTAVNSSTWLTAGQKMTAAGSEASVPVVYLGAVTITFRFQDASVGRGVELNGGIHFPGSLPMLYDGNTLVENGFPLAPETASSLTPAAGGGMTGGSTYSYAYAYAWVDATGNLHRSTPTPEVLVALGGLDTQVTHSIPTLRITRKTGVILETYRRNVTANETILRLVSSSTTPTINDPTADRVTFVDQISDTTAASGEPIYTNGDPAPLEHVAPPPCRAMAVHRGRMLVAGIDGDPAAVWFSKQVIPGFGVAFNDALVSRLSTSEAVTAVGSVDSYAVACTGGNAGSTWASSNDYPDDTGGGGVLVFEHYSGSVGCASPMHMARNDDGLMVWSGTYGAATSGARGPWLITRGMAFEPVGGGVDDEAFIFTPATVLTVPTRNQVRYLGSTSDVGATVGVALVREGFFKTWARWDYARHVAAIVDATIWMGAVAYLASDGTVYTETLGETVLDDLGFAVPHSLDIASFSFGGVAGYQRIYAGQLTGRVIGAAAVFSLAVTQTIDGVAQAAKTLAITGQAADSDLNFEWDPGTGGKCSAYSIRVSDSGNSANCGFSLAAVTMQVGIKKGINKLIPARRAT